MSTVKSLDYPLPKMPENLQVGLIKDFVKIISPTTECPSEFLCSSFMTCFGLSVSPYVARATAHETQPRLYTCNIGESAISRRSTGAKAAVAITTAAVPGAVRMVKGFGSSEGLLRVLQDSHGVPVMDYLDEIDMLFKKTAIHGSAGTTPLHVLYDGNNYEHPLKQGSVSVDGAYLAILANATTERFADVWQSEHIDNGFISRWALFTGHPHVRLSNPPMANEAAVREFSLKYENLMNDLKQRASSRKILISFADDEALGLWDEYYRQEIDITDPMYNRLDTGGERIMVILAVAQYRFSIDADTVRRTLDFLRHQVAIRTVLRPTVAENPVAMLQQKILKRLPVGKSMSYRDILRSVHGERHGSEYFRMAMQGLVDLDFLSSHGKKYQRLSEGQAGPE